MDLKSAAVAAAQGALLACKTAVPSRQRRNSATRSSTVSGGAFVRSIRTETVRILRAIQPLHVTPDTYVFTSMTGAPIEPKVFSTHFYRCLRALGIRVRGIYATKDTFISMALTAGVNAVWLEAQTGVRYETVRRHYGKWLRAEGADQLRKLVAKAPMFSAEDQS